jgi:Flp pilus assembly protein TadB
VISYLMKWLLWEIHTYLLIALDLGLGFVTWLVITGLVPGDAVNFNVEGSLVFIAVCTVPWWLLDRYVQRRIADGH